MTVVQTDYSNRYYEVGAAFKTTGTDTPDAVGGDEEITESVRNHPMHTALPGLPPGIECPLGGTPSLGASVLALTGELADEMRRMATEQRMMESRAIVSEMKSQRSMDVYITKLRKLLKDDPGIEIINIHGKGYKLITPSGEEAAREEGIQVL